MTKIIIVCSSLCELSEFTINEIDAVYCDFGDKLDLDVGEDGDNSEGTDDLFCKNMTFIPKPAERNILTKYNITEDEYDEITAELTDKLSFGGCNLCD